MHDIKKNIRRVFWLYFIMFLMIVLYLGYFMLTSHNTVNSSYNPRLNMNDYSIKRGSIYDRNGSIIAESTYANDKFMRGYPNANTFAHTGGAIGPAKSGIEAKYNFDLQKLDFEIPQRVLNLTTGEPLVGNDIYLTLDKDLQKFVENSLGNTKGGVVVMEPKTGKILSMVSYPSFDPNYILDDWDNLIVDEENSPLINRTTQGLYPPGSIFKVITADAAIENIEDIDNFYYECTGKAYFGDNDEFLIRCYNSVPHGTVNIDKALELSCNTYFAQVTMEMGPEVLKEYAEKYLFNEKYNFDLEHNKSRFELNEESNVSEIIQTAIGQGKTLTTPLHMAMITSAIANNGDMMEPYITEKIVSQWGRPVWKYYPKKIGKIVETDTNDKLKEMMVKVVDTGTGKGGKVSGINIGGKTGTAEIYGGEAHGWFIAFAPAEDPQYVISIVTENTGGTRKAMSMGKSIFEYLLK